MATYRYTVTYEFEAKNFEKAKDRAEGIDRRAVVQDGQIRKAGEARLQAKQT